MINPSCSVSLRWFWYCLSIGFSYSLDLMASLRRCLIQWINFILKFFSYLECRVRKSIFQCELQTVVIAMNQLKSIYLFFYLCSEAFTLAPSKFKPSNRSENLPIPNLWNAFVIQFFKPEASPFLALSFERYFAIGTPSFDKYNTYTSSCSITALSVLPSPSTL